MFKLKDILQINHLLHQNQTVVCMNYLKISFLFFLYLRLSQFSNLKSWSACLKTMKAVVIHQTVKRNATLVINRSSYNKEIESFLDSP